MSCADRRLIWTRYSVGFLRGLAWCLIEQFRVNIFEDDPRAACLFTRFEAHRRFLINIEVTIQSDDQSFI